MKKIAFTGPFADVNFGDYAMLVNNIYDLEIKDITLFSYDNNFLKKIKNDYLKDYNVEIFDVKIREEAHLSRTDGYIYTPIEILSMVQNYKELYKTINNIDVFVVNGGGYFNSLWSKPHRIGKLVKIIAPLLMANQLGKKIIFTGNSYGPFAEDSSFFVSVFNALNNVTFGSRDNLYSPVWMRQIGINDKYIRTIPDDLLLVNDEILNQKLSTTTKSKNYIVMETYLPLEYIQSNIQHFKDFSSKMHKDHGVDIVFLPLNLEHGGMQQAIYLNDRIDHFEYVDISDKGYLPIQDAVDVIKNAKLVLSSRYHAQVVALSVGTPTISVLKEVMGDKRYYYNKNSGILRLTLNETNFDEKYYLGLDYLDTLNFIANNFNEIIKHQNKNYNSQYDRNKEFLSEVRKKFLNEIIN